jgi:hypothetical protein
VLEVRASWAGQEAGLPGWSVADLKLVQVHRENKETAGEDVEEVRGGNWRLGWPDSRADVWRGYEAQ